MKKHIFFPLIVGVSLLTSGCSFNVSGVPTKVTKGWSEAKAINGNLGETITLPDVTYTDGQAYKATKITTYPDGSEKMGDVIELTMSGLYTVTYTAIVDGEVVNKVETFFVDYPQLKVGNPVSSVEYLENPKEAGINADKPGAFVKLAYGDTLSFTKPVYMKDLVSTNLLTKFYVVPSNPGSVDFSAITLTLTNPDNPDNYVKMIYYSHVETNSNGSVSHSSSVCARSDACNVYAGIHQSQGLHTNDKYGLWSGCTFDGYVQPAYASDKIDTCMFCFGFDATTNETFGTGFNLGRSGDKILDLDDPNQVRKVWGGFTSDRVLMSISCDSYSSTTANFVITDIFGVTGEELKSNIFVDDEDPEIKLVNDVTLPSGAVGYTYPIPEAYAYDKISLELPVDVNVYQNYDDPDNRVKVKVENNKFRMENAGLYSIVYETKDHAGNNAKLVKSISVLQNLSKPEFELPTHISEAQVGTYIPLEHSIDIVSHCGEATLNTYYSSASHEKTLVEDGFRLDKVEDFTVYYEAVDMVGQVTSKTYTIHVLNDNIPVLEKEVALPKYFIAGAFYKVPSIKVCLFRNNQLVYEDAKLELTCDGQSKSYGEGEEYSPSINSQRETVNAKIKYNDVVLTSTDILTIKSTGKDDNPNKLDLENYFITKGGDFTLRPNNAKFPEDKERGAYFSSVSGSDFGFDFANYILGMNFSVTLNKVLNAKAGTRVKVILTDADDFNNKISASFTYDGTNTYFEVGSSKVMCLDTLFNVDDERNTFPLAFDGTQFIYNNDVRLTPFTREDGKAFTGFNSQNVYFSLETTSCSNNTSLLVGDLCGYIFKSGTSRDVTAPVIYMPDSIGGTKNLNDVYVTSKMYAYDVLSPNVVFTLTVKNDKNQFAKDVNGNDVNEVDPSKSHDIVLSDYGTYTFKISAQEDPRFVRYPNISSYSRSVHVYDDVKPTLTLLEQFQSEVKVGTEVRFPKFTYSDNHDTQEQLIVQRTYIDAKGRYHYMSETENSIKFIYKGTYKIMINVMDTSGNIANATMYVSVID
ncbi:MAG: hypothetical protein MJ239_02225 [Bacilli bacterium]|nr:hypothetical protein [Bacilli bacterium]